MLRTVVRAAKASSLRSLRRHLEGLRKANAAADAQAAERRRLATLLKRHQWEQQQQQQQQEQDGQRSRDGEDSTGAGGSAGSSKEWVGRAREAERALHKEAVRLLPHNRELESAIAFALRENRDARTELEFTRHLLNSTLLSLASPVGRWDPYDVKPQVFALDNFLALPVFTSVAYLELFCRRFGYTVRGPNGVLWVDGGNPGDADGSAQQQQQQPVAMLTSPEELSGSMWWSKETRLQQEQERQQQQQQRPVQEEGEGVPQPSTVAAGDTGSDGQGKGAVDHDDGAAVDAAELFDLMADDAIPVHAPLRPAVHGATTADATAPVDTPQQQPSDAKGKATGSKKGKGKRRRPRKKSVKEGRGADGATRRPANTESRKKRRRGGVSRRLKGGRTGPKSSQKGSPSASVAGDDDDGPSEEAAAASRSFWSTVAAVSPFDLKQATPLPTFGPFVSPFFVGYFADINTLLHNASIVPDKVDIVLNPLSPTEFVLARAATDRVLHRDQLLLIAYQRVEREIQRELGDFFRRHCPEVRVARSACVPRPLDHRAAAAALRASRTAALTENPLLEQRARTRLLRESEYTGGVAYDLAVLVQSDDIAATFRCLQWGKHQCLVMGHPDLDVLPEEAAAPHVAEAATVFYAASDTVTDAEGVGAAASAAAAATAEGEGSGSLGVFRRVGDTLTVNVSQPADSFYHDPTNNYTEAHAVFTEELKVKRQR